MNQLGERYLNKGISYHNFLELTAKFVLDNSTSGNEQTPEKISFTKLNLRRMQRLDKTIRLRQELIDAAKKLSKPITILAMTESWCGDGAQQMPWLEKLTEVNGNFLLKIVFRDENPDLMDQYLKEGKRSIPVILFIDQANNVLAKLGSRPKQLVDLMEEWSKLDLPKHELGTWIHSWYARNNGHAIQEELIRILQQIG